MSIEVAIIGFIMPIIVLGGAIFMACAMCGEEERPKKRKK